jgi:hypothetical protein
MTEVVESMQQVRIGDGAHVRKMGSFDEKKVGGLSVAAEHRMVAALPQVIMVGIIAQMFYSVKFAPQREKGGLGVAVLISE